MIIPPVTELDKAVRMAENNAELRGLLENLILTLENLSKLRKPVMRTREKLAKYINSRVNRLKDELIESIRKEVNELVKDGNSCLEKESLLVIIEKVLGEQLAYYARNIEFNTTNIVNKELARHTDTIEVLLGLLAIASFLERRRLSPTKHPFLHFLETYVELRQKNHRNSYRLKTKKQKVRRNKSMSTSERFLENIMYAVYDIERGISRVIDNVEVLAENLGRQKYGKDLKSIIKRTFYTMLARMLFKYDETMEVILRITLGRK